MILMILFALYQIIKLSLQIKFLIITYLLFPLVKGARGIFYLQLHLVDLVLFPNQL
jgi:hypothetical protein